MTERTPSAGSEKAEEITPNKTADVDGGALSATKTPAITKDRSEIKSRAKRNIIITPNLPPAEIERDGTRYRRDENGRWRPVLY
ncbi:hypothetical protein EAI_16191 [Harpegnathos saltator]|uniref:Uncharacterized protein n=1 Tax=Harpegnathos saltator TaxID=610380 RepID=E2C6H6_HARSA|nr:hypothetical protein EAI_16191 [Harpegnathos saltator]